MRKIKRTETAGIVGVRGRRRERICGEPRSLAYRAIGRKSFKAREDEKEKEGEGKKEKEKQGGKRKESGGMKRQLNSKCERCFDWDCFWMLRRNVLARA